MREKGRKRGKKPLQSSPIMLGQKSGERDGRIPQAHRRQRQHGPRLRVLTRIKGQVDDIRTIRPRETATLPAPPPPPGFCLGALGRAGAVVDDPDQHHALGPTVGAAGFLGRDLHRPQQPPHGRRCVGQFCGRPGRRRDAAWWQLPGVQRRSRGLCATRRTGTFARRAAPSPAAPGQRRPPGCRPAPCRPKATGPGAAARLNGLSPASPFFFWHRP